MNLILYANNNTGSGRQLQAVIEAIVCKNSIEIYRNVERLSKRLCRRRYAVDIAVLLAASHKELQELLAIKELLHDIRIILLLPDHENETIAKGHKLYPRFLSYLDGNFDDVAAILSKIYIRTKIYSNRSGVGTTVNAYINMFTLVNRCSLYQDFIHT